MYVTAIHPDDATMASDQAGSAYVELKVAGELDLAAINILAAALREQLAAGHRYLRIDLDELTFCDAAGLGALLHSHGRILAKGGAMVVTNVQPFLRTIMKLTRLDTVLLIANETNGTKEIVRCADDTKADNTAK